MIASIQKVMKVEPIKDADKIEKLNILGWEVVSGKGEFKEGNLCIYIEIDSIVPDKPEFEFLKKVNFRIKTIRLRGQISQGIALPMKFLPDGMYKIGDDVSDIIGVKHYEKPIPLSMSGITRGHMPFGIPISDETRVQSIPDIINEITGQKVYITTKYDGTSGTFAMKDMDYHVCSRHNSFFKNDSNVYWIVSEKNQIGQKLKQLNLNIAIRGEVCGPGIQKNKVGLKELDLFVYDIFDIDKYRYYNFKELIDMCETLKLKTVPLEYRVDFTHSLNGLLLLAQGNYQGTNNRKEGIVIRPEVEMRSVANNGRMSFKVINNEYLLKDED